MILKGKCARCSGDGWYYEYDGVGGRWTEKCSACGGNKTAEVVIDLTDEELAALKRTRERIGKLVEEKHDFVETQRAALTERYLGDYEAMKHTVTAIDKLFAATTKGTDHG